MTQIAQGALTLVGLNTPTAQVFWNGQPIPGIKAIAVDWEGRDYRVKLKVITMDPAMQVELMSAGISVQKEKKNG